MPSEPYNAASEPAKFLNPAKAKDFTLISRMNAEMGYNPRKFALSAGNSSYVYFESNKNGASIN